MTFSGHRMHRLPFTTQTKKDYEAMEETLDILGNPRLMKKIHRALKQEKKGEIWKKNAKGKWIKAGKQK